MYINKDVAKICECSLSTVKQYAQKPENSINFVGDGKRKIFVWFEADIKRFKTRDVAPVGRPSVKTAEQEPTQKAKSKKAKK